MTKIWAMASWRQKTYQPPRTKMHAPVGEKKPHDLTCDLCGYHACSCEPFSCRECGFRRPDAHHIRNCGQAEPEPTGTQKYFADALAGISPETLAQWEQRRLTLLHERLVAKNAAGPKPQPREWAPWGDAARLQQMSRAVAKGLAEKEAAYRAKMDAAIAKHNESEPRVLTATVPLEQHPLPYQHFVVTGITEPAEPDPLLPKLLAQFNANNTPKLTLREHEEPRCIFCDGTGTHECPGGRATMRGYIDGRSFSLTGSGSIDVFPGKVDANHFSTERYDRG